MIRTRSAMAILLLFLTGCSSSLQFESRAYSLQHRATEEPLIAAVLHDEIARDPERMATAIEARGGTLKMIEITSDNTAIVRTTPHGHAAIRKALGDAHRQAARAAGGT